jgi:uracil phosphoribosyltransferase
MNNKEPYSMATSDVTYIDHPLIQHKLTIMRDIHTPSATFRQLLREISHLMAYEVCRDLDTEMISIQTPLESDGFTKTQG